MRAAAAEDRTAGVPHRTRLIVVLGALTGLGPLTIDFYLPAFPAIAADLRVAESSVQLTLTAAVIGMGAGQILLGPLSDRYGRRRPLLAGVGVFTACSVACAAAPSIEVLAAARLGQGIGASAGIVISRAIVRDVAAGAQAAAIYSRLLLVFGLAPILGPLVGSVALEAAGWRACFVLLALAGVLLALLTALSLPETAPTPPRSGRPALFPLSSFAALGRDRTFVSYMLAMGFATGALFAYIGASSFVFQEGYDVSPATYAALFGVNALGLVVVSQVNGSLVSRGVSPRRLLVAAAVAMALAGAAAAVAGATAVGGIAALAAPCFVIVASLGSVQPNSTALALTPHGDRAGAAAAMMGATQSVVAGVVAPLTGVGGDNAAVMGIALSACCAVVLAATVAAVRNERRRARSARRRA